MSIQGKVKSTFTNTTRQQSDRRFQPIKTLPQDIHCHYYWKKGKRQRSMNVDMRETNKALKKTNEHVETMQEIRNKLKGETRYSKMDLKNGSHQLYLEE